jgi:hypothetical protein
LIHFIKFGHVFTVNTLVWIFLHLFHSAFVCLLVSASL